MMISGADLIRTSDRLSQFKERLVDAAPLKPAETSPDRKENPDDAKNALLRFARFIREDQGQNKKKKDAPKKDLPTAYRQQLQLESTESGNLLDLFA